MTTDMPADLTRIRDHSHDPAVAFDRDALTVASVPPPIEPALMERIRADLAATYPDGQVTETVTGWVPPPPQDSAYYTPLCAHRDEVAYEHTMDHVAALRRAADEIQAARHATYPHLVTPLKKRRTPKKAGKA